MIAAHVAEHVAEDTSPLALDVTGLTAWDAFKRLADQAHVLFLDSSRFGALGQHSFLAVDPFDFVVAPYGGAGDPFVRLDDLLRSYRVAARPDLPPFQGGVAGLFGYDLAHHIERLPRPRYADVPTPDLAVGCYDVVLSFDHVSGKAWIVSTGLPEAEPERRLARAARRLEHVQRLLDRTTPRVPQPSILSPARLETPAHAIPVEQDLAVRSNFGRGEYLRMIRRGIEYVHAGDCFQVNLAQRLSCPLRDAPLTLYERLRACNPAPFGGYFDLGTFVLASASPERFLRLRDGRIETRPIKGTRPRGHNPREDFARIEDLEASPKDRAENVMIVDLLRNDLGRVCRFGSIDVVSLCKVESYQTVHHLVSEVHGTLRPECTAIDLLRATFPGGSVTGAPKIRAMQIISELELTRRGPYCGSLGYIGFDRTMDLSILIRTFVLGEGWAHFAVGGGIVADSNPEREYEETWHKAEGMLRALRA
jgi:para-aminobenzoate synthetase component 1